LVVGGVSPAADNLGRSHMGRDFRFRRPGRLDLWGWRRAAARGCQRRQRDDRPTKTASPHRRSSLTPVCRVGRGATADSRKMLLSAARLTKWNRSPAELGKARSQRILVSRYGPRKADVRQPWFHLALARVPQRRIALDVEAFCRLGVEVGVGA